MPSKQRFSDFTSLKNYCYTPSDKRGVSRKLARYTRNIGIWNQLDIKQHICFDIINHTLWYITLFRHYWPL